MEVVPADCFVASYVEVVPADCSVEQFYWCHFGDEADDPFHEYVFKCRML